MEPTGLEVRLYEILGKLGIKFAPLPPEDQCRAVTFENGTDSMVIKKSAGENEFFSFEYYLKIPLPDKYTANPEEKTLESIFGQAESSKKLIEEVRAKRKSQPDVLIILRASESQGCSIHKVSSDTTVKLYSSDNCEPAEIADRLVGYLRSLNQG